MYSRIRQLFFLLFGISYAAIACGDAYRCLDSTGHFEYRNIPCSSNSVSANKISISPEVEKNSSTPLKDGSTCPMILAPKPEPSGSSDYRDKLLDRLEADFYGEARSGRMSWVQLVDRFYAKCAELYPGYLQYDLVEVSTYQRVLAEQMDNRRITESEWVYLLEKQAADIRARRQLIENTRPSPIIIQNSPPAATPRDIRPFGTTCTTQNIGTPDFPMYRTNCN